MNRNEKDENLTVETECTLFTEHNLDSTQNELTKNITTKSIILAPFNSTRTHISEEATEIVDTNLRDKAAIKFGAKVRDIDRQYEKNNNCELDNGVYNKFMIQTKTEEKTKMDEDEEKRLINPFSDQEESPAHSPPNESKKISPFGSILNSKRESNKISRTNSITVANFINFNTSHALEIGIF